MSDDLASQNAALDAWFIANANELLACAAAAECRKKRTQQETANAFEESNAKKSRQRSERPLALQKVVSGGQTGADRAGLEAAHGVGLATGGFAPQGFLTSDGADTTLKSKFGLQQIPLPGGKRNSVSVAQMYVQRSIKNVDTSDVTIAFRLKESTGTDKTIGYCQTQKWQVVSNGAKTKNPYRHCLVITDVSDVTEAAERILEFISTHNPRVINICGHRDDTTAGRPGFSSAVRTILTTAFKEIIRRQTTEINPI